jgi:hypothetical protein
MMHAKRIHAIAQISIIATTLSLILAVSLCLALKIHHLPSARSELEIEVLGQVVAKDDIRSMLQAIYPGSPVAAFVTDVLMADDSSFFPAVRLADGRTGHFVAIARCAATELKIAEAALSRRPVHMGAREKAHEVTTRRLWARLVKLRARAEVMALDLALLQASARNAPGLAMAKKARATRTSPSLGNLLRIRPAA